MHKSLRYILAVLPSAIILSLIGISVRSSSDKMKEGFAGVWVILSNVDWWEVLKVTGIFAAGMGFVLWMIVGWLYICKQARAWDKERMQESAKKERRKL